MRMRGFALVAALAVTLAASAVLVFAQGGGRGGAQAGGRGGRGGPAPAGFRLTSTAFVDSSGMASLFSCAAGDSAVSPPLAWVNPPMGTVSYTLILHDLEPRPMRGINDILHWMVWNIPATTTMLPQGVPDTSATLADGSLQSNGNPQGPNFGFRPPCPPPGQPPHHYTFELFALDTKTELPATATRDEVTKAMDGHVLGHAVLMGLFGR